MSDTLMEICDLGCGGEMQAWHATDKLWSKVTGLDPIDGVGSYCINCFDRLAESKGIILFWAPRECPWLLDELNEEEAEKRYAAHRET
jgi:hypothetical protein